MLWGMGNPVDLVVLTQPNSGVTHSGVSMRATTLLNRVLNLTGVRFIDVEPGTVGAADPLVLRVASNARKRLECPHCDFSTMAGYDTRWTESSWRHLNVAGKVTVLTMLRRRLRCLTHGVVVQRVPFVRPDARFTMDFEAMITWLVTRADKGCWACRGMLSHVPYKSSRSGSHRLHAGHCLANQRAPARRTRSWLLRSGNSC